MHTIGLKSLYFIEKYTRDISLGGFRRIDIHFAGMLNKDVNGSIFQTESD